MQKYTKIALIALAGLVVVGGAAFAHKGWKHGFRGHGAMGFSEMVERYDANKDGKISQDEIDTNRTNWLTEADGDKSGTLALAEFQNLWLKAHNSKSFATFSVWTVMPTARSPPRNTSCRSPILSLNWTATRITRFQPMNFRQDGMAL